MHTVIDVPTAVYPHLNQKVRNIVGSFCNERKFGSLKVSIYMAFANNTAQFEVYNIALKWTHFHVFAESDKSN